MQSSSDVLSWHRRMSPDSGRTDELMVDLVPEEAISKN